MGNTEPLDDENTDNVPMEICKNKKGGVIDVIFNLLNIKNEDNFNNQLNISLNTRNKKEENKKNEEKILKLIIRNLTNPIDRKNVEIASKKFYYLCNEIGSYIPISGYENVTRQHIYGDEKGFNFKISNKEICLDIFRTLMPEDFGYHKLRILFNKYAPHMESLFINMKNFSCYDVFKDLECFENIKTVKIDNNFLQRNGFEIFNVCPSLKPINLYIIKTYSNDMNIIDNETFKYPTSIKNIFFESDPKSLNWLLDKMINLPKKYFENFFISENSFLNLISNDDEVNFINIIQYFKKVNYYASDFLLNITDKYISKIFQNLEIQSTINISFSKNNFGTNIFESSEMIKKFDDRRGVILSYPSNRFLSQPGVYLNVHVLRINDKKNSRKNHPFSSYEVKFLTEDISKMNQLEKLDIDLNLFSCFLDFKYFCNSIRSNLNCLRIGKCSTIMSYHLSEISRHFKKLEYLFLDDVGPYTSVTLSKILSEIKYLKGLKIIFNEFYNAKHILDDLERKVDDKKIGVLNWPEIDYLYIVFICSIKEYEDIIFNIEKNTPRMIGKFLVKQKNYQGKMYYHIVIQRSSILFDKFEELFDSKF
ncbi:Hypothetical protein SRAE_1000311100 [Strongyloides ratti]|uniref:Uncharacterized protein n=1 Tax=Strongyloides ratti TaxID=34506 RepID=A0A090L9P3_STRRB|nr:Hypothetical protein SRAE_1000311100 [Strongyloides ratti]CEF64858.1 Hypothetical protein SRAE_1000311100 [Strongyloides ratti]